MTTAIRTAALDASNSEETPPRSWVYFWKVTAKVLQRHSTVVKWLATCPARPPDVEGKTSKIQTAKASRHPRTKVASTRAINNRAEEQVRSDQLGRRIWLRNQLKYTSSQKDLTAEMEDLALESPLRRRSIVTVVVVGCAWPVTAGVAVKRGAFFFLLYGGRASHSANRHAPKKKEHTRVTWPRRGLITRLAQSKEDHETRGRYMYYLT